MKEPILAFALVFAALTLGLPGYAQTRPYEGHYSCSTYQDSSGGRWRAARIVIAANGTATATRDVYEWEPKEAVEFGPGMKLKLQLAYYSPVEARQQKRIAETDIMVDMHFTFEAKNNLTFKKPERSWLHFYRSGDPGKARHPLGTSLSTMTLWHQYGTQRLSTRAIISVDDLLAFGTGREWLDWDIRSAPSELGGTTSIAKGFLPIEPMREAASDILKLRSALNRKAAKYHAYCQIVPTVPVAVAP